MARAQGYLLGLGAGSCELTDLDFGLDGGGEDEGDSECESLCGDPLPIYSTLTPASALPLGCPHPWASAFWLVMVTLGGF